MPRTGSRNPVLVFAKAPRPGAVKTRLIPLLGEQGAAALHARLIKHTLATASTAARGALELHGEPVEDDFLRYCAARYNATLLPQCGSDLGERMHHAFEHALSRDGCTYAVLIGADCPALTAWHLRRALRLLDAGHDAVLAPAEDGGYVLIGLSRLNRELFEGIAWSTAAVMSQTRERLRAFDWRWLELEVLWDVDRPRDYTRLAETRLLGADIHLPRIR
jgi:rSAM/selenodomain-associated transferase 1